ncbi:hypothetical protein RN001_012150 [Aquatica leii]|uniref:Cystinosin n=1 Tax=Aquatica leii TaxID=1421715 RepID=A0AAN7SMB9_9COLE|nr:hypothetical protein RN001_012150 [Aquatica leii]
MFAMFSWDTWKIFLVVYSVLQLSKCDITISTHQLFIKLYETETFNITVTDFNKSNIEVKFHNQYDDIVKTDPDIIYLDSGDQAFEINITAMGAGHSLLTAQATQDVNVNDIYLTATIYKSKAIEVLSITFGWIYFLAWSLSFYPQIITNFKRKSVIGLDFDYMALNLVGYLSYTIFTLGLYYIPPVIEDYFNRYPRGLIPVTFNDNAFNIHGLAAIIFTIIQCVIYERGNQKISLVASIILGVIGFLYGVTIFLVIFQCIYWLDFLYFCSYVKLLITLLKYVPQAVLNYRRKSTEGWSIGGVFLDLAGGVFSILQMILDAHNYDDWVAIFGNASKFGLGLFSVLFQFIFVAQHYILYKPKNKDVY